MTRERKKEISCKKSQTVFTRKKKGENREAFLNRKEDKKRENFLRKSQVKIQQKKS